MRKVADTYRLQRRGNIWYYIRRVPAALTPTFGSVVKMSLHTEKKTDAKRLRTIHDLEWDAKFASSLSPSIDIAEREPSSNLSLDDILDYVRLAVSSRDARSAKELSSDPPRDSLEKQDLLIDAEIEQQILSDPDDPRRDQTITGFLAKLLSQANLTLPENLKSETYEFGRRALIELNRRKLDRYADRFDRLSYDPLFALKPPSISFQKLANEYAAEIKESHKVNNVGLNRQEKVAAFLATLVEIVGPAFAVDQFDDAKVQEVRSILARMPSNRTKFYPTSSVMTAIAEGEKEGRAPISATTQADYLRVFKGVLQFATRRKHLAFDPATDVKPLKKAKSLEERRMPFNNAQLCGFFTGGFYKSCSPASADRYDKPDREWRFWIPLLMLFSGARPNEIAQLSVGDVRESESGNPYLNLFPDVGMDQMKLKTRSSRRRIPIHKELVQLGFLKFVEGQRKGAGAKSRLFPALKPNRLGNYAHYASRRFNEVFLTNEIDVAADQCLYSLRHNVRDALRRVHAPPEALRAIGGWSDGGKSVSDYYGDATNPDHYVKWVNALSYPGLDLSFLHV